MNLKYLPVHNLIVCCKSMLKKRITRILIGVLMPALIGSITILVIGFLIGTHDDLTVEEFFFILGLSYIGIGVQSIIYSLIMEYYVNEKISNSITAVCVSIGIGAISGALMTFIFFDKILAGFIGVGSFVGFVTGVLLRTLYIKSTDIHKKYN